MKLFVIATLVAVAAAGRLEHLERSYLPPHGSNGDFGSPSSPGSFRANSGAFGAAGAGLQGHNAGGNFAGATSNQYLPPNHGSSASNGGSQFASSLQGFGAQQNYRSRQFSGHQAAPVQQYAPVPAQQYAAVPAQQYAAAPVQQYAVVPAQQYAAVPSQQYAAVPAQHYAAAPVQQYAAAPVQHYAAAPVQQYAAAPVQHYAVAPVQHYAAPSSQFGSSQAGSSFGAPSYQQYSQQSAAASRQYLAPNVGSNQQHPQQAFDEQTGYHY